MNIVVGHLFTDLKLHRRRIVIVAPRVRHGDNASFKIGASSRDCLMKIMGEGRDSAAAREIIPDEGHTLEQFHLIVSKQLITGAAFA